MYKSRILKRSDALLFNMPSLEKENIRLDEGPVVLSPEETQRRAYEEGFISGERAGYEAGEQKALVLCERLEKIMGELAAFKDNLVCEIEPQLVDLAVTISRKIIIEEIGMRPEIIVTMVKEALKKMQRMGTITIRINPALYDLFTEKKPGLADIHPDIVFDVISSVPVTGPLVVSRTEEVVTDIDSLLANVMEEMKTATKRQTTDDSNRP
ncbi:MAG: hypothetical protein C4560_02510 [Nitrospiraceae bacterium]|nr:MAG: hypothetical protein C4560_02510 [Nitrospiraceae bacterium]